MRGQKHRVILTPEAVYCADAKTGKVVYEELYNGRRRRRG